MAKINEDASARLIRGYRFPDLGRLRTTTLVFLELRDEIERLKRLLGNANQSGEEGGVVSIAELLALKEKLHSNEQLMVDHTRQEEGLTRQNSPSDHSLRLGLGKNDWICLRDDIEKRRISLK